MPGIHSDGVFRAYITAAAESRLRTMRRHAMVQKRGAGRVVRSVEANGVEPSSDGCSVLSMLAGALPTPSQIVVGRERETRVERAVANLPEPYRTALLLRFAHEQSNEEIAAAASLCSPRTGMPLTAPKQVKAIVHRARSMLAAALPDLFPAP